jgi:hypothetical protein
VRALVSDVFLLIGLSIIRKSKKVLLGASRLLLMLSAVVEKSASASA